MLENRAQCGASGTSNGSAAGCQRLTTLVTIKHDDALSTRGLKKAAENMCEVKQQKPPLAKQEEAKR